MIRVMGWQSAVMLGLLLVVSAQAQGALSLAGTRLIFDGQYREASLEVRNRGGSDVLVQAWLSDPGDDDATPLPQRRPVPFVVTPPLSRLTGGARQIIRVLYQGAGMASDRESLLHLYVLEVPQRRTGVRQVNIALRRRINLFYRPVGLAGDPADTAGQLVWSIAADVRGNMMLHVSNPTVYHAALETLVLDGEPISDDALLPPGGQLDFRLPASKRLLTEQRLKFRALTDYGGQRSFCTRLNGQASSSADLLDNTSPQDEC